MLTMLDSSVTRAVVGVTLLAIVVSILDAFRTRYKKGLREIPGPPFAAWSRLWTLHNASTGRAPLNYIALHKKYGQVVRVGPNHVSLADPEMISVIYGTNNKYVKTPFYNVFSTELDGKRLHGLFSTQSVPEHKALKQTVANKYSLSALQKFEPQVDECTNLFTSVMEEYAKNGKVIDLGEWLQWYAFDTIGAITFHRKFGFMEERRDVSSIIANLENGLHYGALVGQVPGVHEYIFGSNNFMRFMSLFPAARAGNPIPIVIKMVEDAIKKYDDEEKGTDRNDFLAWFRKENEKDPDRMSHRTLMNYLMTNLLAGSDTTAISLRAILYYLIKSPTCYKKLIREILLAEKENPSEYISYSASSKMSYLQACIKEAMRVHPAVSFLLQRFVPDGGLDVGKYHIPAGTAVGISAWVIHQDKSIYGEDADTFRPERWVDAEPEQLKMMDRYFFSFGAGTRTCIGKNISLMEMGKLIPQVLKTFDISWASEQDDWTVKHFWFGKQIGLQAKFHLRTEEEARRIMA